MSPAAHALDRRLHVLREAHRTLSGVVAEIEANGTYAVLAAGSLISGVTAARARPAVDQLESVRRGLDEVDRLLDEVAALRRPGQIGEDRAAELFLHLNSPSVLHGNHAVVPQDLLVALGQAVVPLVTLIGEVDAVWREFVPRLDRATAEAERLAEAMPTSGGLGTARHQLAKLAGRVIHDPLGAVEELTAVESALAGEGEVAVKLPGLREALAEATTTVEVLKDLLAEGREAHARSRTEIRDAEGLVDPVDPDVLTGERGLEPWLARLERLVAEGKVELAEKGLASWRAFADQNLATARQVAELNGGPTRRRRELRSLLRAARVKAGASGQAEAPRLTELARQADAALAVPCRLADAEAGVAKYVEELRLTPTPAQSQPTSARGDGRAEVA